MAERTPHGGGAQLDLLLDPAIRDWVLLPVMVIMVLVGVFRYYITQLFAAQPKTSLTLLREQQPLVAAQTLMANGGLLPQRAFEARRALLVERLANAADGNGAGAGAGASGDGGGMPNPLMDPAGMEVMMEGMKSNMTMIIPQTVMMSWITYFFSGFVVARLPFPLSMRFKAMLQRDIDTADLDVRWVSALSWYFLNLVGLRSVFAFLLDDGGAGMLQALNPAAAMMPGVAGGAGQPPPNIRALCKAAKEDLELAQHLDGLSGVLSSPEALPAPAKQ